MTTPLSFQPLYQTRVWGGRTLESKFHRPLPKDGHPYGESWELVDREDAQSVVIGASPYAGKTLHELWSHLREEIFGPAAARMQSGRFPLLCKILDARDKLSIQVHPPAAIAPSLNGEPKTEMWYIADAEPGATLYAGLKAGVTRDSFATGIPNGTTESQVHSIRASAGESIFIPSGRLHAIGAGLLIYEIQQNSDTTYRVFDWNRVGLDGKPRALHVEESLKCIDFSDTEPSMDQPDGAVLATCEFFQVEKHVLAPHGETPALGLPSPEQFAIFTVTEGNVTCGDQSFTPGAFFLVPAHSDLKVEAKDLPATVLRTHIP